MPTSFDKIIDVALLTVNDYKFLKLYNQSQEGFQKWCDGFLLAAIPNFFQCRQSLDFDLEQRQFVNELTFTEISL